MPPTKAAIRRSFAAFVARALRDARARGMTDLDIARVTGIPGGTFHRWQKPDDGGLPQLDKVIAFCRGLEIPVEIAGAVLGLSSSGKPPAPAPIDDPDLVRLGRVLGDPNVPEETRQAIRHTIRALVSNALAARSR